MTETQVKIFNLLSEILKKTEEHIYIFEKSSSLNLDWFFAKAKKRVGRNPAIITHDEIELIRAFLAELAENLDKEVAGILSK